MAKSSLLNQQLAQLPDSPGVYIMHDAKGVIVYVGKATSLKNRVRSYFQSGIKKSPKTVAQMKVVESIEWVVVSSPEEALVLECNLIKEHNPKYNIMLRDDKHYPYLMLTTNEQYPRLVVVRSTKNDGNRYFGPYVSSSAMRLTQQLISKIFPLRSCSTHNFRSRKRPCLNAHIGKCLAPCDGGVDKALYDDMVKQVIWFLEGKTSHIIKNLQEKMEQASEELRFEDAARYRDQIEAVRKVQSSQQMDVGVDNRDMVAVLPKKMWQWLWYSLCVKARWWARIISSWRTPPATLCLSWYPPFFRDITTGWISCRQRFACRRRRRTPRNWPNISLPNEEPRCSLQCPR